MCRRASRLNVIAFIIFILAFVACGVSFAAPFWVVYPHAFKAWKIESVPENLRTDIGQSIGVAWKGMLAYCFSDAKCSWFWQNDFDLEKGLPDWYKVSQGAHALGLITLMITLLLQSIYSCCRCCKNPVTYPTVVASFCTTGAILVGLSLGLFGGFALREGWFDPSQTGGYIAKLDWAFYTGIAGAATAFLAAMLFFCDGCCVSSTYRGYSVPSVKS